MSILSDAFLENMLNDGMPVMIVPERYLKKKKKPLEESFEERTNLNSRINMNKPSMSVVPSPVPG